MIQHQRQRSLPQTPGRLEPPERVLPASAVTYSRNKGESRAPSDDETSKQSSDDGAEVAERSLAPSLDRTPTDLPVESTSASYMSSNEYQQWLIDERAQFWDKFSELNLGWQPKSDGESNEDLWVTRRAA